MAENTSAVGRPSYGKITRKASPRRWTSNTFGAIEPPRLHSILKRAEQGDLELYADLCSFILTTDPDVRSKWETRVTPVAGSDFVVEPGWLPEGASPQMVAAAEKAAAFCEQQLKNTPGIADRFSDLLNEGNGVCVGVLEHRWRVRGGIVSTVPEWVPARDLRFCDDWAVHARTYPQDGGVEWIDLSTQPRKFIVHQPRNTTARPSQTGALMAIMWPWLIKRWIEKYGVAGFERLANGLLIGITGPNTGADARDALHENLENATAAGVGVVESVDGTSALPIHLLEPTHNPGLTAVEVIKHYEDLISKALLGSGLNVEVQSTGGNRALGESQFDTTILPRLVADARRLAETVSRDWLAPLVAFNTHLWGGITPPTPTLRFELVADDGPETAIDELAVNSLAVTKDELRKSRGLPEWGPERGGDVIVTPVAKSPVSALPTLSGGEPGRPKARARLSATTQLRLPIPDRKSATPTREPSAPSPLSLALSSASDDPAR